MKACQKRGKIKMQVKKEEFVHSGVMGGGGGEREKSPAYLKLIAI